MNNYTVRHYYTNPRNNEEITGLSKKDAIAEAINMTSDESGSSSAIFMDGRLIADRDWSKKNLRWVK